MSDTNDTSPLDRIRNFSIIAHIDHGKSTLADRLIQTTGALTAREMTEQVLDNMDIEKERGITIKAQTVRLTYRAHGWPRLHAEPDGHAGPRGLRLRSLPFSLAACEGSLLVVDASPRASRRRRLANVYQALDAGHEIVPILNKIDLPAAEPERVKPADRGRHRPRCVGRGR